MLTLTSRPLQKFCEHRDEHLRRVLLGVVVLQTLEVALILKEPVKVGHRVRGPVTRVVHRDELSRELFWSRRALPQSVDQRIRMLLNERKLVGAAMHNQEELHMGALLLQHQLAVRREATLGRVFAHHDGNHLSEEVALRAKHEKVVLVDSELAPDVVITHQASVKDNPAESF